MATVIGPASENENARAILSLEFSKSIHSSSQQDLAKLSLEELKSMFAEAHSRSNEVFKELKPTKQPLTEREMVDRYKPTHVMQGDLPDGIDALLGEFALETNSGLATCIVFIQTSYESPWSFALCIVGNDELSYYGVFDPTNGTFGTCKNVDVDIRSRLEAVPDALYYRALFVRHGAATTAVAVKKEPVAAAAVVAEETKPKKPAAVRKRPAPTPTPTAAPQPEEKKATPASPAPAATVPAQKNE